MFPGPAGSVGRPPSFVSDVAFSRSHFGTSDISRSLSRRAPALTALADMPVNRRTVSQAVERSRSPAPCAAAAAAAASEGQGPLQSKGYGKGKDATGKGKNKGWDDNSSGSSGSKGKGKSEEPKGKGKGKEVEPVKGKGKGKSKERGLLWATYQHVVPHDLSTGSPKLQHINVAVCEQASENIA